MLRTLITGALAGTAGTITMTVALRRVFPALLPESMQWKEFLPKTVVEGVEAQTVGPGALTEDEEMGVTLPAHFAYGATMGMIYGVVRARLTRGSPMLLGALYGLAVWAVSYEGWLPAAGILEATTRLPPRKWPVPILAHLVYGATTGLAYAAASRRINRGSEPRR